MSNVVLLLEDEQDLALLVSELLSDAGYEVVHVTTLEECLARAEANSYCAALLDGGPSSRFDLWWLGEKFQQFGIPAIAFTAHASAVDEFQADPHGYAGVILKPFEADEFLAMVDSVCRSPAQSATS